MGGAMKIDLNVQTTGLLGELTVFELVLRASSAGITHMALCDYGTTEKLASLKDISYVYGIKIINGVSFCTYDSVTHQLVTLRGYSFQDSHPHIEELFNQKHSLETEDVLRAIIADGGKVVLARPHEIDSSSIMHRLVHYGLSGVERFYPNAYLYEEELSEMDEYIKCFGLMVTGGSFDETHQRDELLRGTYLCPNEVLPWLMNVKRVAVI